MSRTKEANSENNGTIQCPTCGTTGTRPLAAPWTKVYIEEEGLFGAFCSNRCLENHWVTNRTGEQQQRLDEIEANTDNDPSYSSTSLDAK